MSLLLSITLAAMFGLLYARHDALDWKLKEKGRGLNHKARLTIRLVFVVILSVLVSGFSVQLIATVPALFLAMHIPFDPYLNITMGLKWHYVGTTAKYDILLRKIFPNKPGAASITIEILLLIASIITYNLI